VGCLRIQQNLFASPKSRKNPREIGGFFVRSSVLSRSVTLSRAAAVVGVTISGRPGEAGRAHRLARAGQNWRVLVRAGPPSPLCDGSGCKIYIKPLTRPENPKQDESTKPRAVPCSPVRLGEAGLLRRLAT